MLFSINGIEPDVSVISLQRQANILEGENSGRLKSGDMVRDVIGTTYNYAFEVAPKLENVAAYDDLYETITAPVASYPITVPFGQGMLEYDAYVSSVNDELTYMGSKNLWDKLLFTAMAISPQRYAGGTWTMGTGSGNGVFSINDVEFNASVTKLERKGEVLETSRKQSKSGVISREVLGTIYNYSMQIEQNIDNVVEYDRLYYALTAPVNSMAIKVPYGQGTLSFQAYVTEVRDSLIFVSDKLRRWGQLEIDFMAMQPKRRA